MAIDYPVHIEVGNTDKTRRSLTSAWLLFVASALVLAAGFFYLGIDGMLNFSAPDFFPVPHALSAFLAVFGLISLAQVMRNTARTNVFGTSTVDCNKPVLGGALAGVLKIEKADGLTAPIAMRLHCDWNYRISYEDGEGSKPAKKILWEHTQELPSGGAATGIPFRFAIPTTCLASGWRSVPRGPKENAAIKKTAGPVTWHLTATSKRSGIDYLADFEIRVRPEGYVEKPDADDDEVDDLEDFSVGEKR